MASKLIYLELLLSIICVINALDVNILMPGVVPSSDDEYICATFPVPNATKESYVVSYEPIANHSTAHHVLLFGCTSPFSNAASYPCTKVCDYGQEQVLFVWARGGTRFEYPDDTGLMIGGKTGINYFVLQVHYLKPLRIKDHTGMKVTITETPLNYVVDIILLFSYYGIIPPHKSKVHLDVSCRYKGESEGYTLGYRTHAHTLSRSISGFKVSAVDGQVELIGKGSPQWPQVFYKSPLVLVRPDDILMARCLYDSKDRDSSTVIGSTHHDEMCNFYIMLVTKNNGKHNKDLSCGGNEYKDLWKNIPSYSMEYDAPNPDPNLFFTVSSLNDYGMGYKSLKVDRKWKVNYKLGEVSGISVLSTSPLQSYTLLVFHRGSHQWTAKSFDSDVYQQDTSHPISEDAILEIDSNSGNVLRKAGRNLFYLPHGITVTKDNKYVWITDVALHQVMRFRVRKDSKLLDETPDIILGERFVPGNDRSHFCKPAKVAVNREGYIFVADGYCNNRVMCFFPNGTFMNEWRPYPRILIAHSITIEEDKSGDISKDVIWVADRENMRLIGFNFDGSIKTDFSSDNLALPIYGIEYNPSNQLIYGVSSNVTNGMTFTFNVSTYSLIKPWDSNSSLHAPHDLCLAEDGRSVFVVEIYQRQVIKFHREHSLDQHRNVFSKSFSDIYHTKISNISLTPVIIGISLILVVLFIILCVLSLKYYRRCQRNSGKIRRYGNSFKDKEGFRPLTQDDDANDDGNSDPETEEYSTPRGNLLKKPKA